jgi:zinc transport system substrate-binding protein
MARALKHCFLLLFLSCPLIATLAAVPPKVVVTLKPIHSLVLGVMQGVGKPELLLSGFEDPHHFTLSPSQSQKIKQADLVIWMGPALEHFMIKPLAVYQPHQMALLSTKDLMLRPQRGQGCAHTDNHPHLHDHHCAHGNDALMDPHAWLDINNAILMVQAIATALVAQDPDHAALYQHNAVNLGKKLADLQEELHQASQTPLVFLAFHDAYGYLEQPYGIKNQAAGLINSTGHLSLKAMTKIRALFKQGAIQCVVVEPQHPSEMAHKLAAEFNVPICKLDPLGLEIPASPGHYFTMMTQLITQLQECQSNHAAKPLL